MEQFLRSKISQTNIEDIVYATKIYQTLEDLKHNNYGMSVCLGYDSSMSSHVYPMDHDIYAGKDYNVLDNDFKDKLKLSSIYDGAVLVSGQGVLKHSGMYFGHDPIQALFSMGKTLNNQTLWQAYNFCLPVCSRHISAISASFHLPLTYIFVLSEEYSTIRVFHRGKIIYSSFKQEINI
ncbi:hypothetical protein D6777_04500 [Candidatus Woesearchaeota archaeon]|nr:MAG: hypothetical protein D6777_04500 [Candidatus Woesearchaeota archaeon]